MSYIHTVSSRIDRNRMNAVEETNIKQLYQNASLALNKSSVTRSVLNASAGYFALTGGLGSFMGQGTFRSMLTPPDSDPNNQGQNLNLERNIWLANAAIAFLPYTVASIASSIYQPIQNRAFHAMGREVDAKLNDLMTKVENYSELFGEDRSNIHLNELKNLKLKFHSAQDGTMVHRDDFRKALNKIEESIEEMVNDSSINVETRV